MKLNSKKVFISLVASSLIVSAGLSNQVVCEIDSDYDNSYSMGDEIYFQLNSNSTVAIDKTSTMLSNLESNLVSGLSLGTTPELSAIITSGNIPSACSDFTNFEANSTHSNTFKIVLGDMPTLGLNDEFNISSSATGLSYDIYFPLLMMGSDMNNSFNDMNSSFNCSDMNSDVDLNATITLSDNLNLSDSCEWGWDINESKPCDSLNIELLDSNGYSICSASVNSDAKFSLGLDSSKEYFVRLMVDDRVDETTGEEIYNWNEYYITSIANSKASLINGYDILWIEELNATDNYIWKPDTETLSISSSQNIEIDLINAPVHDTTCSNGDFTLSGSLTLPSGIVPSSTCDWGWDSVNNKSCDSISVNVIDERGMWVCGKNIDSSSYSLTLDEGNYTVEFILNDAIDEATNTEIWDWQSYFVDVSTDGDFSLKNSMNVMWEEDSGFWRPNVGYLSLTQDKIFDFDFTLAPKSFYEYEVYGTLTRDSISDSASIELINNLTGSIYYSYIDSESEDFSLYIPSYEVDNSEGNYSIRVSEYSSDYNQYYLNVGDDHSIGGSDDFIVDSTLVPTIFDEFSYSEIPDTNMSGYLTIDSSNIDSDGKFNLGDIDIRLETIGSSLYMLSGSISNLDLVDDGLENSSLSVSDNYTNTWIELIDAHTGWWLNSTEVNSDGTYKLKIGSLLNEKDSGEYIVRVSVDKFDYENPESSFWKSFYLDDSELVEEWDIGWEEVEKDGTYYWIPDVEPLSLSESDFTDKIATLDIDFPKAEAIDGEISGSISNLTQNAYINASNIKSWYGDGTSLNSGDTNYTIDNLKDGEYLLEISFDSGEYYYVDAVSGDLVNSMEVNWKPYDSDNNLISEDTMYAGVDFDWSTIEYWKPEGVKLATISGSAVTVDLTIPEEPVKNSLNLTLSNFTAESGSLSLEVPGKPIYYWRDLDSNSFTFENLKATDSEDSNLSYYLRFWIDNSNEVYVDGDGELIENAYWVGVYENNNTICEDWKSSTWSCDYSNKVIWVPAENNGTDTEIIKPITISSIENTPTNISVDFTSYFSNMHLFSATLDLDLSEGDEVYVNMWEPYEWSSNGGNYYYRTLYADIDGNVDFEFEVKSGDYILDIYSPKLNNSFVATKGEDGIWSSSDDSLMLYQKLWSWSDGGSWSIDESAKISLDGDLTLDTLALPELNRVTITLQNLSKDSSGVVNEDIWISLEGLNDEGWYGAGNANWSNIVDWSNPTPTYSEKISLKVPSGNYKLYLYSNKHKSGVGSDGDENSNEVITTFEKFSWDYESYDKVTISGSKSIIAKLPSLANLKYVEGEVDITNPTGYICAYRSSGEYDDGCSDVNGSGSFKIEGLSPNSNDEYSYEYWSNSGVFLEGSFTFADGDSLTNQSISAGDITISGSSQAGNEIALLKVKESDKSWEFTGKSVVVDSGEFSFENLSTLATGYIYALAVKVDEVDTTTGASSATFYSSKKVDNSSISLDGISDSSSYTITIDAD